MNDLTLSPSTHATATASSDTFAIAQAEPESLRDKADREYRESAARFRGPETAVEREELEAAEDAEDIAAIAAAKAEGGPYKPLREVLAEIDAEREAEIRAEIPGNVVDATAELAAMPEPASKPPLTFTADQLAAAGVVFQATDQTKFVEINAAAQAALIALAPGYVANEIVAAILATYGIEGQVQTNTHPATQTLSLWQSTSPKDDAAAEPAARPSGNLTTEELLAMHESTCGAAREIMRAKNNDYTDGSVDPFANFRTAESLGVPAEIGLMIRMLDKMKRVQTFVNKGTLQVKGESVEDSILDLVNYSILLKGIIVSRRLTAAEEVA